MNYKLIYFISFCLTLGKYSCFINIKTDGYEQLIYDIGGQFFAGLCPYFNRTELFGVKCAEEYTDYNQDENIYDTVVQIEMTYPTVTVGALGTAVGTLMKTYLDKPFHAYMGIRFGTAGKFEMPQLYEEPFVEDFMGGYDATYIKYKCPQPSLILPVVAGDEDCLFLNIFTPQNADVFTEKYPVMVYIYGGGFTMGDGSLYIPSRLMEKDVIVVVLQYRVGTLGFLYSGTTSAPGNMGLMDQITALRWVKKYILYFNGDEDNVTVFGESAGAASTSWMQLTPQNSAEYNNGSQLLNKIILQSGSALEIWTLDRDYETSIIKHGNETGCYENGFTPDDIVACMKGLPIADIVIGSNLVIAAEMHEANLGFIGVVPVIQYELLKSLQDEDEIHKYIVIPNDPIDMIDAGDFNHIDVMAGSVRDEGSLVAGILYSAYILPNDLLHNETFAEYFSIPLLVNVFGIPDTTGAISNSFRLGFLPNAEMGEGAQMIGGAIDLGGMLFLKSGLWRMIQLLTKQNPDSNIYFYSFEYESTNSLFEWLFFSNPEIPFEGGICHGDDLLYLFALPGVLDDSDKATSNKMATLWANFASFSDPTPDSSSTWVDLTSKWEPYSFEKENFLLMEDTFSLSEDFVKRWNYNMFN